MDFLEGKLAAPRADLCALWELLVFLQTAIQGVDRDVAEEGQNLGGDESPQHLPTMRLNRGITSRLR